MRLETEGLEELLGDLKKVMELPDRVQEDMLNAEADVVVQAQKDMIERLGLTDSFQLRDSIARNRKVSSDSKNGIGKYLDIYPQGTRERGKEGKRKKYGRNAEVGFIYEYGAPERKIKAYNWMKSANEKSEEQAVEEAAGVYDEFLKKNNL